MTTDSKQKNDDSLQSETRAQINDIFKQVVVGRDWKSHANAVYQLYKTERSEVVKSLESIVLKIMVIPASQQRSAHELINIFIKVYDTMLKQARQDENEHKVFKLFNEHIETSFKLT